MAINPKDLIVLLQAFARAEALPLDASEIQDSIESAEAYIKQPNAYPGQTIKVLVDGQYKQYILQPTEQGDLELKEATADSVLENKNYTDQAVKEATAIYKNDQITDKHFKVIATDKDHVGTIPPADGQLLFIQDMKMACFDFDGKREFYHDIISVDTEDERLSLEPINGKYYFVISTATLWSYFEDKWNQLTNKPEEIVCIGADVPELGKENVLYANTKARNIKVWDEKSQSYIEIANWCGVATLDDIYNMFN